MKKHSLCTILYDYDYNLSIDIREVDGGEDDDYSIMTVRPSQLRNVSELQVRVREDASVVSTERTSCAKASITAGAAAKIGKGKKKDDQYQSGKIIPEPLTTKATLFTAKSCD
jgi:hypothetical protein